MQIEVITKYPQTPFSVSTQSVQNKPGTWNSTKVSIFRDDKLIGEYLRNYSSRGAKTFYPFQVNGDWYALYSSNYTATRVMKLHEDRIEDWCGEDPAANGFCPTEYYVPKYIHSKHTMNIQGKDDTYDIYYVDCDMEDEFEGEMNGNDFVSLNYCNFGFLSGCVWGDDTSWKLRYIDLSRIPEKILTITSKFGYWELPDDSTLQECIRMDGWEPGHDWINLTRAEYINLKTDERS